jgi:hypothetical protein
LASGSKEGPIHQLLLELNEKLSLPLPSQALFMTSPQVSRLKWQNLQVRWMMLLGLIYSAVATNKSNQ